MNVWVLYDAMNEEVVGVFSTKEAAEVAAVADPQAATYLSIEEFTLDNPTGRS